MDRRTLSLNSATPSLSPAGGYVFSEVGTSRCDVRAACSGASLSNCQFRSVIRSARYYAGGDGAARRPYHRAKHILGGTPKTTGETPALPKINCIVPA